MAADPRPHIRLVKWIDSSLPTADDHQEPRVIESIGWVVEETAEYVSLARDNMGRCDGDFRGTIQISKRSVVE